MLSRIRVKQACFVCGGDLSLSRYLAGMPCPRCEANEDRIQDALTWPAPYQRLLERFKRVQGTPPPRAWQPWTLAVLNRESIHIPLLPEYRPLEFILWMAGGYRGPVVLGVSPRDREQVLRSRLLTEKVFILQGKPDAEEVRIVTQPREIAEWNFREFRCFMGWALPSTPALEEARTHGTLVVQVESAFPYQIIPGAQWLGPEAEKTQEADRTWNFPGLRFRPEHLPEAPEVLTSLLYQLLPYLPETFRPLYQALARLPDPPPDVLNRIRRTLAEALLDPLVQRRLRSAGIFRDSYLEVADLAQFLKALREAQHPRVKAKVALDVQQAELRLLDRALHPQGHVLRRLPAPAPLRDTQTLLVLPEQGPTGRDLGFTHLWERRAAGFTVFEGIGNLGPMTLLRLPPVFRIQGTTLIPDPETFSRLRRLFRRYPRITIMSDEPFLCQAILLAALARPFGARTKLLRFTNLYALEFDALDETEQSKVLEDRLSLHIQSEREAKPIISQGLLHVPDPRLYRLLRTIAAFVPSQNRARARVVVDGLFFEFPLPEDEIQPEAWRKEIRVTTTVEEGEIAPPSPHKLETLVHASTEATLKEQLQALQHLYQLGLITIPWVETRISPFFEEMARRYIQSVWGEAYMSQEVLEGRRGLLTTRPIDRQDLELLTQRFPIRGTALDLYDRIFRRWIAGFLRPTRVRWMRIRVESPWGTQEKTVPYEVLEMGFNVLVPLKLGTIPATGTYRVTRVERFRPPIPGVPIGTLIRWAAEYIPDQSPLQSVWQILAYLQWTEHGIRLTPETRRTLEDLELID